MPPQMSNDLDFTRLKKHLEEKLFGDAESIEISIISGGYSNLTFFIQSPKGKFALRRPPFGEKISKAHDMEREFNVLSSLNKAGYSKSPNPVFFCEDVDVFGAPFFVMEFVEGLILRNKIPKGIEFTPEDFRKLSEKTLDCLLELHSLELNDSGLIQLGKPEGYVTRQVEGWIERYFKAKTNELSEMEKVADWLKSNIPSTENIGFIHNDYKYDNLVLDPENASEIKSVLDWEMATVGDPLMDLGTSLAYWAEPGDPDILKMFNLTYLPGNLTRQEVIEYYGRKSQLDLSNILFYYIFGLFKVAVIAQQIYKRFTQGHANDPRFSALIHVVEAAGKRAHESILTEKI